MGRGRGRGAHNDSRPAACKQACKQEQARKKASKLIKRKISKLTMRQMGRKLLKCIQLCHTHLKYEGTAKVHSNEQAPAATVTDLIHGSHRLQSS